MNRTKELLALAPFAALAIAISYLQGYWGAFEILAFPYLSFQELLAYSTAPLFGFVIASFIGILLGFLNSIALGRQQKSRWITHLEDISVITLCAVLIYLDRPEKWLIVPIIIYGFIGPTILRMTAVQSARESNPQLVFSIYLICFFLIGSFGYGRTQAERLIKEKDATVTVTLEAGSEAGKLIGKLGSYYFYLSTLNQVTVIPEQAIKRIDYKKVHKSG